MDPVSQGVLGAVASLSVVKKNRILPVLFTGAVGGMLADVDIFIRSNTDPLLALEYHRHFTHSLIFIPLGGLMAACLLWFLVRKHLSFKTLYLSTTVGYATHGLLDACTSYGTQLLWPFSSMRIAWNIISIIDPIFTGILIVALILAFWRNRVFWARLGLACSLFYLILGYVQKERALTFQSSLAQQRGETILRSRVHPSFGNLLVWRSTYETGQEYVVDALRVGLGEPVFYEGQRVPMLDVSRQWPKISEQSVLARDIEKFRWFSDNWLYSVAPPEGMVSDLRYSMLPHTITPLWGILVDPGKQDEPAPFVQVQRVRKSEGKILWKMLKGEELDKKN